MQFAGERPGPESDPREPQGGLSHRSDCGAIAPPDQRTQHRGQGHQPQYGGYGGEQHGDDPHLVRKIAIEAAASVPRASKVMTTVSPGSTTSMPMLAFFMSAADAATELVMRPAKSLAEPGEMMVN